MSWLNSLTTVGAASAVTAYVPGQGWRPRTVAPAAGQQGAAGLPGRAAGRDKRRGVLKDRLARAVRGRRSVMPRAGAAGSAAAAAAAATAAGRGGGAADGPGDSAAASTPQGRESVGSIGSLLSADSVGRLTPADSPVPPIAAQAAAPRPSAAGRSDTGSAPSAAGRVDSDSDSDSDDSDEFVTGIDAIREAIAGRSKAPAGPPASVARVSIMGAGRRSVMFRRVTRSQSRAMHGAKAPEPAPRPAPRVEAGPAPAAPAAPRPRAHAAAPASSRDLQALRLMRRVSMGVAAMVGGAGQRHPAASADAFRASIGGSGPVPLPGLSSASAASAAARRRASAAAGSLAGASRSSLPPRSGIGMPADLTAALARRRTVAPASAKLPSCVAEDEDEDDDDDDDDEEELEAEARAGAGAEENEAAAAAPPAAAGRLLERCLPLVLEWVSAHDLLTAVPLVCRSWSRAGAAAFNWRAAEVTEEVVQEGDDDVDGADGDDEGAVRAVLERRAADARLADGTVTLSGIRLGVPLLARHRAFHEAHPWGAFLSEGAYKRVFAVWSTALRRREAVSVMDVEAIADAGACEVVRAEVRCACLVSELVRTGVSPNFVETFQVLATSFEPSAELWGTEEDRVPRGPLSAEALSWPADGSFDLPAPAGADAVTGPNAVDVGVYQLARMELCSGGDVEEYLRRIEPMVAAVEEAEAEEAAGWAVRDVGAPLPVDRWFMGCAAPAPGAAGSVGSGALGLAAQLLLSLLAARDRLAMRHWDVKLLNCLLMPVDAVRPGPATGADGDPVGVLVAEADPSLGGGSGSNGSGGAPLDGVVLRYDVPAPAAPDDVADAARSGAGSGPAAGAAHGPLSIVLPRSERAALPRPWIVGRASGSDTDEAARAARLQLSGQPGFILKLADFGTADTRAASYGQPIRSRHITTLENTAVDVLVLGDGAAQTFAADTWAAGLCLLHLLTGAAPYEEVLDDVICPPALRTALYAAWKRPPGRSPRFAALGPVLRDDEDDGILANTLVRFAVLFGLGADVAGQESRSAVPPGLLAPADADGDASTAAPASFLSSPVWRTLVAWLAGDGEAASAAKAAGVRLPRVARRRGKAAAAEAEAKASARRWFETIQDRFNVWTGDAPLLRRARRRMAAVPGTATLLLALCHLDPDARPPASASLASSPAFAALRAEPADDLASYGRLRLPALATCARDDV